MAERAEGGISAGEIESTWVIPRSASNDSAWRGSSGKSLKIAAGTRADQLNDIREVR